MSYRALKRSWGDSLIRSVRLSLSFALVFGGWGAALAQSIQTTDFTQNIKLKTQALGFGGAFRAVGDANATILLNPAGIALNKGAVNMSGDFVSGGPGGSSFFSASIVDFKATDFVALGFEYDRDSFSVGTDATLNLFSLAAATAYGEVLYVGGAFKGYFGTIDSPFVTNPGGVDIDLGVLVKPIPMVSMGLTLENVFRGASEYNFPLILGFGSALDLRPFGRIAIDVTKNFQTDSPDSVNAYFGGEVRAAEGVFLKGGFGLDAVLNNNFYAVGLAIKGPQIGLHFTFAQRLNPTEETYAGNIEMAF